MKTKMDKPLFISTDRDIPGIRKAVIDWLTLVRSFGGPDVLFFESFLTNPIQRDTDSAINQCLTKARDDADGGYVVVHKSPGSAITGNAPIARSTRNDIKKWCRRKKRRHIIQCLPKNRQSPPVSWGEAFIIKTTNKRPLVPLIYKPSIELALEYVKVARDCASDNVNLIRSKLKELFARYPDILNANSTPHSTPLVSDDALWKMIWFCEYVSWFQQENISIVEWDRQDEILAFFKTEFNWVELATHASSFWTNGSPNALAAIKNLADQLHGEIWIWNSDLRILRNEQWIRDIYLPLADRYSRIKIIVTEEVANMARVTWKQDLIKSLDRMAQSGADIKISLGIIKNTGFVGSLVALFGAESTTCSGKRIIMMTPHLINGHDHECVNFVLEPTGPNGSTGEGAVTTFLEREIKSKMQDIVFKPLRLYLT